LKGGLKKRRRTLFPPRWKPGYPLTWLGLNSYLGIYREAKTNADLRTVVKRRPKRKIAGMRGRCL
jgi:hypothetical protein